MVATLTPTSSAALTDRARVQCKQGRFEEAVKLLESEAFELGSCDRLRPRALSYYGLAIMFSQKGQTSRAIGFCQEALRRDPVDPEIYHNLARVYLQAGSKRNAVKVLNAGLRVDPNHRGLKTARNELGVRSRPCVGSLGRSHAINRLLGRLLHALKRGR
jgi:tetratricopeptide (TPR) repeat protein